MRMRKNLSRAERIELRARVLRLGYYLMRAPLWEVGTRCGWAQSVTCAVAHQRPHHRRERVARILGVLRSYVPLIAPLCHGTLEYLDSMQALDTFTYGH